MNWFDREIAALLARDDGQPAFPPLHPEQLRLAAFLEAGQPDAEWTRVLALLWRLQHELPGLCQGCAVRVCFDREWLVEDPDGPIPQIGHDAVMRHYRLTDHGRAAAGEVLP